MNRDQLVKAIKGRRVLAWIKLGHNNLMIEVAPSKVIRALYEGDHYEFIHVQTRDTGDFIEIRAEVTA